MTHYEILNRTNLEKLNNLMECATTKSEHARLNNILAMLENDNVVKDSGINGKIFEMLTVGKRSRKQKVSKQGKIDGYFTLNGKRHSLEMKTNSGRIGGLYTNDGNIKKGYIVYKLNIDTRPYKLKNGQMSESVHRELPPLIFKYATFIAILEHVGAIKVIGHKDIGDYEKSIDAYSKKLYEVLQDYPIEFNPEMKYTDDDFADIELW